MDNLRIITLTLLLAGATLTSAEPFDDVSAFFRQKVRSAQVNHTIRTRNDTTISSAEEDTVKFTSLFQFYPGMIKDSIHYNGVSAEITDKYQPDGSRKERTSNIRYKYHYEKRTGDTLIIYEGRNSTTQILDKRGYMISSSTTNRFGATINQSRRMAVEGVGYREESNNLSMTGDTLSTETRLFNQENLLLERFLKDQEGTIIENDRYAYDEAGHPTQISRWNSLKEETESFDYTRKGAPLHHFLWRWDFLEEEQPALISQTTYQYDANNELIQREEVDGSGKSIALYKRKGDQSVERRTDGEQSSLTQTQYDRYGNVVHQRIERRIHTSLVIEEYDVDYQYDE